MKDRRRRRSGRRSKEDVRKFAEELAPLEEQKKESDAQTKGSQTRDGGPEHGAIVIDEKSVNLPRGMEDEKEVKYGIERVVLVILGLMLAYIAFVTWQIAQMPAK